MSRGIQCCTTCGRLEDGHTGPANHYTCGACELAAEIEGVRARLHDPELSEPYLDDVMQRAARFLRRSVR